VLERRWLRPSSEYLALVLGDPLLARRGETVMSVIWWTIAAVIWIAIAFWPARVAGRKGHSFIGYFIFSLFFFPAALIVAYLVDNRTMVPGRARTAVS
jgi:hypothetical protein